MLNKIKNKIRNNEKYTKEDYNNEVYEYLLGEKPDLNTVGYIISIQLGQRTVNPSY